MIASLDVTEALRASGALGDVATERLRAGYVEPAATVDGTAGATLLRVRLYDVDKAVAHADRGEDGWIWTVRFGGSTYRLEEFHKIDVEDGVAVLEVVFTEEAA